MQTIPIGIANVLIDQSPVRRNLEPGRYAHVLVENDEGVNMRGVRINNDADWGHFISLVISMLGEKVSAVFLTYSVTDQDPSVVVKADAGVLIVPGQELSFIEWNYDGDTTRFFQMGEQHKEALSKGVGVAETLRILGAPKVTVTFNDNQNAA